MRQIVFHFEKIQLRWGKFSFLFFSNKNGDVEDTNHNNKYSNADDENNSNSDNNEKYYYY